MWIAGVSLVQMVRPEKKGLSNGLLMASLGLGSVVGPLAGRWMLYQRKFGRHLAAGEWSEFGLKWGSFELATSTPQVVDFIPIFWILAFTILLSGLLIGIWGQRPGRFAHDEQAAGWAQTVHDLGRLVRNRRFWALVITLCFLGGPVFQATNQYLPFRAEDLGLKSGAADNGWVWLQLLRTVMWIPGGLAVGLLAGRRAPGLAAVAMLGAFSLAGIGIGGSVVAWQLFAFAAVFEFVRQFMRWSHAGYLSEHMPNDLRSTVIGCSITLAGLGSTIYG